MGNIIYYDTNKTTELARLYGQITVGQFDEGDLKGYSKWKILYTNNPTITDLNIVYSNGNILPVSDESFSYSLYAYVEPSPPPPVMSFSMRSLFSNNAQVYYKPHSLAPGGTAGVKNSRIKSRRT